jgi:hypothetical protein
MVGALISFIKQFHQSDFSYSNLNITQNYLTGFDIRLKPTGGEFLNDNLEPLILLCSFSPQSNEGFLIVEESLDLVNPQNVTP